MFLSTARIRVITPAVQTGGLQDMVEFVRSLGSAEVEISHTFLDRGPVSIENYIDDALTVPDLLLKAVAAEQDGCDGIVINCMCDPGLYAVREAVSIPVMGPAEVAMHTACILGHTFGFIDVLETSRTMVHDQAARYGVAARLGAFRAVNVPVLEIEKDMKRTVALLVKEAEKAVREDHVDVIVLGCAGFSGCAEQMEVAFRDKGLHVPIINPLPLVVHTLAAIVRSGLTHSKKAYPLPPEKAAPRGYEWPFSER